VAVFTAVGALSAAGALGIRPANRVEITVILGDPIAFADGATAEHRIAATILSDGSILGVATTVCAGTLVFDPTVALKT